MAGGALGSAFIPTFTGLLTQNSRPLAWKLASAIANLLLIVLTLVAGLAAVFAPQIVRDGLFYLAPDLPAGQEALTVLLLRMLLPTVVIFGLSGLVMGILNAHQRFWLPAIAPAMYSLGQIGGVLLLPPEWGIDRLAMGALIGALLHLLVQMPGLLRLREGTRPTLGLHLAEVRQVAVLMGPRILGVAVVQINFIVNTILALSLPEGSVSAITLAFTLMLMPQVAIAQSAAIAAMPTFSAQVALGKLEEMRGSLASTLRAVLLLAIPATVGLILLRFPLIRFLYEGGEFTSRSNRAGSLGAAVVRRRAGRAQPGGDPGARLLRAARHAHAGGGGRGCDEPEHPVQLCFPGAVPRDGAGSRMAGWRWPTRWRPRWRWLDCWC